MVYAYVFVEKKAVLFEIVKLFSWMIVLFQSAKLNFQAVL